VLVDEQTNNTVAGIILKPLADAGDEDAEVAI
jgi:hypothetical protein